MEDNKMTSAINAKYSSIARHTAPPTKSTSSCCKPSAPTSNQKTPETNGTSCCKPSSTSQSNGISTTQTNGNQTDSTQTNGNSSPQDYASRVATAFGYPPSLLQSLPPNTNLGLSCGNPLALTNVAPSETIIDLGSGGGLDCLLAARSMVSTSSKHSTPLTGKVYGIDSSTDMIALAERNVKAANLPSRNVSSEKSANADVAGTASISSSLVEFIHSEITSIPLPDLSTDLIISNCVINLVSDTLKPAVFQETYRLLAPGGRLAISDILSLKPLPEDLRNNVALVVGCVAGAASVDEYKKWMVEAGFEEEKIVFKANGSDLNAYKLTAEELEKEGTEGGCCGGGGGCGANIRENGKLFDEEVRDIDFNEWVASFEIYAVK